MVSNEPDIDVLGARMLKRLYEELQELDLEFKIAEAHGPVREILRSEDLEPLVGAITRRAALADLLESP